MHQGETDRRTSPYLNEFGGFMNKCLSLAAGLLAVTLCTPAHAADTIKIGVAGAHSGDLASYGQPSLNAARLVIDDYNAKGGVLGKMLEIVAQDDQCKPEMATNAATKIVSDGVTVVMGHICSGATKASLPIYNDAKVVSMSPSATTPVLTLSGENPYFFRTIANDLDQARLASVFIKDKLKIKKIAMLHDNGDYGKGYVEAVREQLKAAGADTEVVLFEAINPDAVDFSASVRKLRRSGAELLVFGGYHPTASKLVQQIKRERMNVAFLGPDGLKDDAFIAMGGADAEGVYASYPKDTSKLPAYIKAHDDHVKKYNAEPGAFYYNGYSATQALVNAIEKAGTATDVPKIMEALRTEYVDTPTGKLRFNARGDAAGMSLSIYQVQNGKYVELEDTITLD